MISKNKSIMEVGLFPLAGQYFNEVIKAISYGLWILAVFLFGPRKENSSLDELDKLYLKVTIWSAIGTGILALAAFVGNFNLIANLAFEHGISFPMAYLIPFALDGFVVISILIVLGAALVGQKAGMIKLLVLMSSLTGIYFNVANVITGSEQIELMSILLHSILGAMLYLAVEVTAHQITSYIRRKATLRTSEVLQQEIDNLKIRKNNLFNEVETEKQLKLQPIKYQIETAKEELSRLSKKTDQANNFTEDDIKTAYFLGKEGNATGKQIAVLLGKSEKSASLGNNIKNKIKPIINGAITK